MKIMIFDENHGIFTKMTKIDKLSKPENRHFWALKITSKKQQFATFSGGQSRPPFQVVYKSVTLMHISD